MCFLVGGCGGAVEGGGALESDLNLVFIANEGVLVHTDTEKVLIDALFTDPNPAYAAPTAEMLDGMVHGNPPFNDVALALVTHNHPDHFDPSVAGRFLRNNLEAVLVAPLDAVTVMEESIEQWTDISHRVISISLDPGDSMLRHIDGIAVTAYRTLHSGQREEPQNLMYLVEMEGRTFFHEGDSDGSPATFTQLGLGDADIDLALVHFWFPTNLEAERILQGILKADHVGLFHLPKRLMEDAPETIAQVSGNYADMFLLMHPGETRTFPQNASGREN